MRSVLSDFEDLEYGINIFKQHEIEIWYYPNSEVLCDFSEGFSRVFKDPTDLQPGSQRVAVGGWFVLYGLL